MKKFNDARDWFFDKRYGMFIHWGLYAIKAFHEQIWWRKNMRREEYVKLIDEFRAENFSADAWLDLAEAGGMKYICFTAKHHDGFCLWDTAQTDFNVMNSPCGRDILAELSEACRRRNFPLVVYYSVVDWYQRNYPNYGRHHEIEVQDESLYDMEKYMDFLKAQIREICSNYGTIHGIWWDMNVPEHCDRSVNAMIRELQPLAVINDRGFDTGVRGADNGDFTTPEREVPSGRVFNTPVEGCESLTMHSWGYKHDADFFSLRALQEKMDRIMAMGGNYLLNVGPRPDGTVAPEYADIVRKIGNWYGRIGEAFTGTESCSELSDNAHVLLTRNEKSIFVHVPGIISGSCLDLAPFDQMPSKATLLNAPERELQCVVDSGTQVWKEAKECLRIRNIPADDFSHEAIVIKLDF